MPAPIIRKISSLKHRIIKHKPYYASSSRVGLWESNITSSDSVSNLFDGFQKRGSLSGTSSYTTASFSASHHINSVHGYTLTFDLGKPRTIDHIRMYNGINYSGSLKNPQGHTAQWPTASLPFRFKFWNGGKNPITENETTQSLSWIHYSQSLDQFIYRPGTLNNYQFVTIQVSGGYNSSSGDTSGGGGINQHSHSIDNVVSLREIDIYESVDTKDFNVEFDDALLDLQGWAGPRYRGCKTIGKKINEYHGPELNYGIGYAKILHGIHSPSLGPANHGGFIVGSNYKNINYEGDQTFGLKPNVQNKTTALYIANTLISADGEDPQFATIKNHSYINIDKILIINPDDDTVKILESLSQDFTSYHRYITNDFPTGAKFHIKLLDKYLQANLKDEYTVKMNKGWLLKSFAYHAESGPLPGMDKDRTTEIPHVVYSQANPLSLYDAVAGAHIEGPQGGVLGVDLPGAGNLYNYTDATSNELDFSSSLLSYQYQLYGSGSYPTGSNEGYEQYSSSYSPNAGGQLRFRYGTSGYVSSNRLPTSGIGSSYIMQPLYTGDNTEFIENKYTRRFILPTNRPATDVKSFHFPKIEELEAIYDDDFDMWYTSSKHNPSITASVFIGNCINYLNNHSTETELHLTLFQGTKDFSGIDDELSISTFEVDRNLSPSYLDVNSNIGPLINNIGPRNKVIRLKNQPQFKPNIQPVSGAESRVFYETIESAKWQAEFQEIQNPFVYGPGTPHHNLFTGSNNTSLNNVYNYAFRDTDNYPIGFNQYAPTNFNNTPNTLNIEGMNSSGDTASDIHANHSDNFSGSFSYELSFLDNDHTLIADVDKDIEIFDGIGGSGIVLIPKEATRLLKNNIEYYLEIAGLIPKTTATKKDTTNPD